MTRHILSSTVAQQLEYPTPKTPEKHWTINPKTPYTPYLQTLHELQNGSQHARRRLLGQRRQARVAPHGKQGFSDKQVNAPDEQIRRKRRRWRLLALVAAVAADLVLLVPAAQTRHNKTIYQNRKACRDEKRTLLTGNKTLALEKKKNAQKHQDKTVGFLPTFV